MHVLLKLFYLGLVISFFSSSSSSYFLLYSLLISIVIHTQKKMEKEDSRSLFINHPEKKQLSISLREFTLFRQLLLRWPAGLLTLHCAQKCWRSFIRHGQIFP